VASSFNMLDVVVWVIVLYSVIQGFAKGVTRQIVSLGALVVGLLLAGWYYPKVAALLVPYVRTWEVAAFIAFILIFIVVKLVGAGVGLLLGKILSAAELRWFDRVLGGFFGLAKGFLLSAVIFVALLAFPFNLKWVRNAAMAPYLLQGAQFIAAITPPEVKVRFDEGLSKLRTIWRDSKVI
jgi:membrane protein required for colicin V production